MHPSQQLANCAPSFNSSCSLSPSEELFDAALMLDAIVPNVQEEFLFHVNDIIMQKRAICSNLEEQLMATTPDFMFTDIYSHDHVFTHVGNDNAEDECFWVNFVGQSQTLNDNASFSASRSMSPAYFSRETSGTNLADMDTQFVPLLPVYSEASSFSAHQFINNHVNENLDINPCKHSNSTNSMCTSFSPSFFPGETSETYLANTNYSFIHPLPVYSDASSFVAVNQYDPLYMSDHTNDHLTMHMGIHPNATNSVRASILPNANAPMTYSGSATSNIGTSDDDFFDNEASSFVAFASPPPHELHFAIAGTNQRALNLEARASQRQLNLEAGANLLHKAPCYRMNTAGAFRNPSDCEAGKSGEAVSILVDSSTPAIEDGYTWHKYGQKIIKDRAHPRGYFRCAQPNCSVKKQTESSSDKQGFVLITYFGRHNHLSTKHQQFYEGLELNGFYKS